LRYLISQDKVAVSADRIQAVLDAPQPRNDSEARGLLRVLVKLRRFKPKIAKKKLYSNQKTSVFNFRPDPMLALIVETDASTKAQEAALIQETNINGVLERRLIYAASRSLKPAETKCSKIRRELLVVVFALRKFKRFLKVTHFIIATDHRSLEGCLKKSILSFEKVDLRNLVAKISNF